MKRYVIAKVLFCNGGEVCPHDYGCDEMDFEPVLDLPDAEHMHLHRRPDGTWSAVPMRQVRPARTYAADVASSDALRRRAWVHAPVQGDAQ